MMLPAGTTATVDDTAMSQWTLWKGPWIYEEHVKAATRDGTWMMLDVYERKGGMERD